mgnify:CR=1 FL=1
MPSPVQSQTLGNFGAIQEKLESIRETIRLLENTANTITRNRYYRFTTFTAHPGSSIADQLEKRRAHSKTGVAARGGDFPHIIDAALKKAIRDTKDFENFANNASVPKGMVSQYFCYVSNSNKGEVVASLTFPSEFFETDMRVSTTRHPDMARLNKFDTSSLGRYEKYLKSEFDRLKQKLEVEINDYLSKENSIFTGAEMITRSVIDLEKSEGILVKIDSTDFNTNHSNKLPFYCPICFGELMHMMEQSVYKNIDIEPSKIVFPPIPETSFKLNIFCTENKHKNHRKDECVDLMHIHSELNDYRTSRGAKLFSLICLNITNKEIQERFGSWIWLEIS